MKKIILIVALLASAFFIVACQSEQKAPTVDDEYTLVTPIAPAGKSGSTSTTAPFQTFEPYPPINTTYKWWVRDNNPELGKVEKWRTCYPLSGGKGIVYEWTGAPLELNEKWCVPQPDDLGVKQIILVKHTPTPAKPSSTTKTPVKPATPKPAATAGPDCTKTKPTDSTLWTWSTSGNMWQYSNEKQLSFTLGTLYKEGKYFNGVTKKTFDIKPGDKIEGGSTITIWCKSPGEK